MKPILIACLLLAGCIQRNEQEQSTGTTTSTTRTTEVVEGTQQGQPTSLKKTVVSETISTEEARREREATIRMQPSLPVTGLDWPSLLMAAGTALLGGHATGFLHGRGRKKKAVA
jgi:hypothetical protein